MVLVCSVGQCTLGYVDHDEEELLATLEKGNFEVVVVVGDGPGTASILTTDLTPAYVEFNGERS